MIFLAVAGPTPFNPSKSFSLAVFRSTGVLGAAFAGSLDFSARFAVVLEVLGA
jgi:hypothetical protein